MGHSKLRPQNLKCSLTARLLECLLVMWLCPPPLSAVRGGIFQLLGTLCEVYPEHMATYSERLVGIYMRTLKAEVCGVCVCVCVHVSMTLY